MTDENDMRAQLNERRRATTNHYGNPGVDGSCTSSCCVVATVATGSAHSAEVAALRRIRDGLLRRSEIGFDFSCHLHDDCDAFSPEICRLMAGSRVLLEEIRDFFVGPLTACLELMVTYTLGRAATETLGRRVSSRLSESPELLRLSPDELSVVEAVLDGPGSPVLHGSPELRMLAALLDERARSSEIVRWALLEPIRMTIATLRLVHASAGPEAIGAHLAQAFDAWAVELPLTHAWHGLSRYALARELELLGHALVRTPVARARLATRLLSHMGGRSDVDELLQAAWSGDEETPS